MYRTAGLVILILGFALTYSLVFTTFNRPVERFTFNEAGGLDQVSIECPTPLSLLFGDAEQQVEHAAEARLCVFTARTLLVEGVIVIALALGLGIWGITRGPRPRPKSMRDLPSVSGSGEGDS